MRVLYLDLNAPDLIEDYSRTNPNKYGGGSCVMKHLMPWLNENGHYCEIWGDLKCFENVESKFKKFCKELTYEDKENLKNGAPLSSLSSEFDIVLHNFYNNKINCEGIKTKDVVWLVGYGEHINPDNTRIILYNDYQSPRISNPNTKVYKARIGVSIPPFKEYKKEGYIFSCHRQALCFGSEIIMQLAHKYKLRYIAAGPQSDFKNIQKYVDNKYVTYLGIIDDKTKIAYYKKAMCSTWLHQWPTPMSLGALESLSYGTPIITTSMGFWPSFVKIHENGFFANNEQEFCMAISNIGLISQKECYNTIGEYSADKMVQDYLAVFKDI